MLFVIDYPSQSISLETSAFDLDTSDGFAIDDSNWLVAAPVWVEPKLGAHR